MSKKSIKLSEVRKEYAADLLKERIYATLALLAVLISIDTDHNSAIHSALIISGTIFSLWAASIVSALMARRVVYQDNLDHERDRDDQLRKHAPMLAALMFPLMMVTLAIIGAISLRTAVDISITGSLLLLVLWSILSARALRAKKVPTFILVLAELGIGLGIVLIKALLGH